MKADKVQAEQTATLMASGEPLPGPVEAVATSWADYLDRLREGAQVLPSSAPRSRTFVKQ